MGSSNRILRAALAWSIAAARSEASTGWRNWEMPSINASMSMPRPPMSTDPKMTASLAVGRARRGNEQGGRDRWESDVFGGGDRPCLPGTEAGTDAHRDGPPQFPV